MRLPWTQLTFPAMTAPSMRSLARDLGLSAATVSLALRDSPRVVATTKRRVVEAAARAGYVANPLVGSVLAAVRRSSHGGFHGALMVLNYSEKAEPELLAFHREILIGAKRRALELGYSLTHAWLGPRLLAPSRISAIIEARGVRGVIMIPFPETRDLSELNWPALSGVAMDYCLSAPLLHTVLPNHQQSLLTAMEHLVKMGYRRPGLMIEHARDKRLKYGWSAGFYSACRANFGAIEVPVLTDSPLDRAAFLKWFRRHRPDVVMAHAQREVKGWLRELGLSVPRDVGFVALNASECTAPCAALDQQPLLLGAAAVESVVAQVQRNEQGVPPAPKTIMLPARWEHGPTVRQRA
jgi:LacI family transcriptional regulator